MKRMLTLAAGLLVAASLLAGEVTRVEPLSWWTGMKTDLQLLVQGPGIGAYAVSVDGKGLKIKEVHKADNPNFLFVDVEVSSKAKPGTYTLVFKNGNDVVRYPYEIAARKPGSADRESFTTADLIYLIVPDRFANGDPSNDSVADATEKANRGEPFGRHGGDLQGVIDHLDYIADLGATALWSTPLLGDNAPRGSYHGYACSDYYHIDPRYGSNELYREMVAKAHEKGIKVILDVVTNHSSTEHWWMQDMPFKDWVHMNDPYVNSNHQMGLALDPNASKADLAIMEEGWFVRNMPDMNLDNPYMLKYFQQWAVWWIEYSGLDGFRVDTWFYNEKVPMSQWAKAVTELQHRGRGVAGQSRLRRLLAEGQPQLRRLQLLPAVHHGLPAAGGHDRRADRADPGPRGAAAGPAPGPRPPRGTGHLRRVQRPVARFHLPRPEPYAHLPVEPRHRPHRRHLRP